jgi:hypothetical protein
LVDLYEKKQLTRIPGLSVLLGVKTMPESGKFTSLFSNPDDLAMAGYKCEKFSNYKDMKFKTKEIKPFPRENELIMLLSNRKRPKIKEMGEFLAEQLFDSWMKDESSSEMYLKDLSKRFSQFYEMDQDSRIVNHHKMFNIKQARGMSIQIDRIFNLKDKGKLLVFNSESLTN